MKSSYLQRKKRKKKNSSDYNIKYSEACDQKRVRRLLDMWVDRLRPVTAHCKHTKLPIWSLNVQFCKIGNYFIHHNSIEIPFFLFGKVFLKTPFSRDVLFAEYRSSQSITQETNCVLDFDGNLYVQA